MKLRVIILLLLTGLALVSLSPAQTTTYKYFRIGSPTDAVTKISAGFALMGGGDDLDEAFRWLCDKAPGGDFLVLRAAGDDDYNVYVNGLCHLNSMATLLIPDRQAAQDPKVAEIIHHAEVIFISGGDQARYINYWQNTPVRDALRAHLAAGKPIGGTSAGLAVLGEFIYSAQGDAPDDPDLASSQTLVNPYLPRVTVRRDFLHIQLLNNTLTDTHFAKRDRMGRSLTFLARIVQDGWSKRPREIAVDEKSAVLLEPDGKAKVVGPGRGAYFIAVREPPSACRPNTPLTMRNFAVYHAPQGTTFDVKRWTGSGGVAYTLSVEQGKVLSTQRGGQIY